MHDKTTVLCYVSFLAKLQQKCDIYVNNMTFEQWNVVQRKVLLVHFTFLAIKR